MIEAVRVMVQSWEDGVEAELDVDGEEIETQIQRMALLLEQIGVPIKRSKK